MPKKKKDGEVDLQYLKPAQVAKIEQEIDSLETMLKNDQSGYYGRPKISDVGEFMKQIKTKKDLLAKHVPTKLRGQASNKAYAMVKELAEKIKKELPSKHNYYMPYPKGESSFDFERVVQQQVRFQTDKNIQSMVREYKRLAARLDPSDPTIRDIERLRD
jgi:hypothetical protein